MTRHAVAELLNGSENTSIENSVTEVEKNLDTFFILVNSMIIMFMQCGFAFLEAGSVRSKNTTNILLKNLLDAFIGCFIYWAIGYALAFGEGGAFVGGTGWFGSFPDSQRIKWIFQFVFAATSTTIISGAVAERCDIWPYFIYSTLITGVVYPIASRWVWYDGGWLANGKSIIEGAFFQDFAGSGVVHLTGGVAAMIGALFCGPRLGRFEMGSVNTLPGHSVPLAALGAFILLFGFLAFNGGSQFSISQPGDGEAVAKAVMNTIISGTGGAIASLSLFKFVGFLQERHYGLEEIKSSWSLLTTINGALVGMVAVCAGCDAYNSWSAFIVGCIASIVYLGISIVMVKLKIDDPLDAVAVHFGGGFWGLLAAPLFSKISRPETFLGKQFAVNLIGAVAITSWSAIWAILIFGSMKAFNVLRVSKAMELSGMDIEKHGEPAYPVAAWKEGWCDFVSSKRLSSAHLFSALRSMSMDSKQSQQSQQVYFNPEFETDVSISGSRRPSSISSSQNSRVASSTQAFDATYSLKTDNKI